MFVVLLNCVVCVNVGNGLACVCYGRLLYVVSGYYGILLYCSAMDCCAVVLFCVLCVCWKMMEVESGYYGMLFTERSGHEQNSGLRTDTRLYCLPGPVPQTPGPRRNKTQQKISLPSRQEDEVRTSQIK